jgi:hypothetical protein
VLQATVTREAGSIREFRSEDISRVVALHGRVFGTSATRTPQKLAACFEEILLKNPWRDSSLPSLVATKNGDITGFLGVVPRPMMLQNRRIRVAVCTQFMVDPQHRIDLCAVQLLKAFFAGPQDLALADGANEGARRMWLALGASAPLLYSLHWLRPLRPARYILSLLERRAGRLQSLAVAGRPLATLADTTLARTPLNLFRGKATELSDEPLDADTMCAHLPEVMHGTMLQPKYDPRALNWLLDQAGRMTRHGTFRARAVRDAQRRLIGWYIHYVRAGSISEAVQIAARDGAFARVMQQLVLDAWRNGATAVRGRLDPRFAQELTDNHCWLRRDGNWTLVHSRDADVLAAIHQGKLFLSRLEGEWWMRFLEE